jgi:ribosome recycling factor
MPDMLLMEALEKMDKTLESYQRELNTVRTGRANPNLLDSIRIEYYGVLTPVKQIASITVPEASQLYIKPFDRSCLKAIEIAISTSELGLNPQTDGVGIRLIIPRMTEERRRELVKVVGKMQETAKVGIRNIRRDLNDAIKKLGLPEDEEKGWLEDSQKYTDEYISKIEKMTSEKEKELMTI